MNKNYIVYCHINKINGKKYIGITQNIKKRWNPSSYQKCQKFYSAIKKYGWNNFEHIIIHKNLTKEQACQQEITLIKKHKTQNRNYGYNVSVGGEIFMIGYKFTDDQKKKLSKIKKGKNKGIHFSPNTEFKIGHQVDEEIRKKISESNKGKTPWNKGLKGYNSGDKNPMKRPEVRKKTMGKNNANAKIVYQYNINNDFIRKWDFMSEIKQELNFNCSNISKCCNNKIKTAYGYIWSFKSPEEAQ